MKTQGVLVAVSMLTSVALLGLINVRRKEEAKEQKHLSFETIKLRVTRDVLGEYHHEVIRAHNLLDKTKAQVDTLGSELPPLQAAEAKKKSELEACQGEKKHAADEVGAVEAENSNSKTEFEKQKAAWEAEVTSLKQQVEQHSKVCAFVKKDSVEGRKLRTQAWGPKEEMSRAGVDEENEKSNMESKTRQINRPDEKWRPF
ncbi:hypothetical protein J4Q44_G00025470 [Coregonus suidteri]|uniref:Uncharacterized protein n=1 Tax=Coregonus suidteri TaxID=861788 RepID=A0AAN8RGL1_9TELE